MYRASQCFQVVMAVAFALMQSVGLQAEEQQPGHQGPAEVISEVTTQVMEVVAEANTYLMKILIATTAKSTALCQSWSIGEVLRRR